MKRIVVAASLIGLSVMAMPVLAGKEEREFLKNEVVPRVKEAETKFRSACGCALAITAELDK